MRIQGAISVCICHAFDCALAGAHAAFNLRALKSRPSGCGGRQRHARRGRCRVSAPTAHRTAPWRGVIEEYRDRLPVTDATPVVTRAAIASSASIYWDNPQAGAIGVDAGPPSQIDQNFISGIPTTHGIATAPTRASSKS